MFPDDELREPTLHFVDQEDSFRNVHIDHEQTPDAKYGSQKAYENLRNLRNLKDVQNNFVRRHPFIRKAPRNPAFWKRLDQELRTERVQLQGSSLFEGKEDVKVTISEDLAEGSSANLDRFLKLLRAQEFKLLVPTDTFEDMEEHIIDRAAELQLGNPALRDYQIQLMLLEQQNQKRRLMARAQPAPPMTKFRRGSPPPVKRRQRKVKARKGLSQPSSEHQSSGRSEKVVAQQQSLHDQEYDMVDGDSEAQSDASAGTLHFGEQLNLPPLFDVVFQIVCTDNDGACHDAKAFKTYPFTTETNEDANRLHLNGTQPIYDLKTFVEDNDDRTAFVLVKSADCAEAAMTIAHTTKPIPWKERLFVKSDVSKKALDQIATCYFHTASGDDRETPYDLTRKAFSIPNSSLIDSRLFLFHHRHLLEPYAKQNPESQKYMEALDKFSMDSYGPEFADVDVLFDKGLVNSHSVYLLFKPNDYVISGSSGRPAAFILQEWPQVSADGWMTLYCWSFQPDGTGFARKRSVISIPPLGSNTCKITALVAYPLQYAASELVQRILGTGKKQWELRKAQQVAYKGWNVKKDQYYVSRLKGRWIWLIVNDLKPDSRFMVDHSIYRKMHEHARAFTFERPSKTHPFDRFAPYLNYDEEPSNDQLLLMPLDIHGFDLNEKKWIQLFVDGFQPVTWNKQAYDRLVLPPQHKELVRAVVTVRTSQRGVKQGLGIAGKRTDITYGKGNGLIMLLHGGPGTGKTLTAESVAEIAEMPLYRVTCGDIGTNAQDVEKYLNTVLYLGKIWNCVLLLDEADIFLEERSMSDLKRNSLVSVFLRVLEYYDGILILTSNRVGIFDEAFKSRIQIALHYENLNRSARKKIWQNFLDMLEEDEEDADFAELGFRLDDLAGKALNGRQIRNVLTTARQLALFNNERLAWKQLEQALSVSSDFNEYLQHMQGHSDDQRARDSGLR